MNPPLFDAGHRRRQLRQQWLRQAEAAFDLSVDGGPVPPSVTFAQRGGRACFLTRELAVLQVRAAYLSEDGRAERYGACPRPHRRAAGRGRLRRPAAAPQ